MQKIIEIRSSQGALAEKLYDYTRQGWRIVSTNRGSEWTRILNTYKWMVILEKDDPAPKTTSSNSIADELIKAKQLLDSGAITETEYNALKNKLLNN